MEENVIVVTDPAINLVNKDPDDVFALLFAFLSPEITVTAVVLSYGNVPLRQAERSMAILLGMLCKRDILILKGSSKPLVRNLLSEFGEELESPFELDANNMIRNNGIAHINTMITGAPNKYSVISISPMTALAQALQRNASLAHAVRRCLIMGGSLNWPSPSSVVPEWNVLCDPDAARIILRSPMKKILFPLDVTMQVRLRKGQLASLAGQSHILRWLLNVTSSWFDQESHKEYGIPLHDLLPFAYLVDPSLFETEKMCLQVGVDPHRSDYGKIYRVPCGNEGYPCNVVTAVNSEGVIELLLSRYKKLQESES